MSQRRERRLRREARIAEQEAALRRSEGYRRGPLGNDNPTLAKVLHKNLVQPGRSKDVRKASRAWVLDADGHIWQTHEDKVLRPIRLSAGHMRLTLATPRTLVMRGSGWKRKRGGIPSPRPETSGYVNVVVETPYKTMAIIETDKLAFAFYQGSRRVIGELATK